MRQTSLFIDDSLPATNATTSTFADNLTLPIHRWFRYPAGFSAIWVRQLIGREMTGGRRTVLDPFVGSGTVLLEGEASGVETVGIESHPFVARVAKAKLLWHASHREFLNYAVAVLSRAKRMTGTANGYPKLIEKCFAPDSLKKLDTLRRAWEEDNDETPNSELTWLALTSILRECSTAGTAPWQYVLPRKKKARTVDPYEAFESKVILMSSDMSMRRLRSLSARARLLQEDARSCASLPDAWADLVITSPPYANNYDYADATRLEMSFFGEVQSWGDLQDAVRRHLIRACTQHVAELNGQTNKMLTDPLLVPIREEIAKVCTLLEAEREHHGGKKPYHTMIAAYFSDMARVWVALRRVTARGALVCFVVGDSAPYGIYVPVDRWLGELAVAAGFKSFSFEKLRSRNIKWKNRKHRVPLHEGCLWIEG
ncbi:MAG: DNA modification methylase [Thermodesulfobacteriota bacterium]